MTTMDSTAKYKVLTERLVAGLKRPEAYAHPVNDPVVVHETHISFVFLAGEFAYKIKKPVKTEFLDYTTLEKRRHFCEEELRLDRRFSDDLYVAVVPITFADEAVKVQGEGETIEFAVQMNRFPETALLSQQIERGRLTRGKVLQLADSVAVFHQDAVACYSGIALKWPGFLTQNTRQIFETVEADLDDECSRVLDVLRDWTNEFFRENFQRLTNRINGGFIRACHGDLHADNIIDWRGKLRPFDGIEFNDQLRWIDVLSDASFLAMDLSARGHLDLSRLFLNAYLERTGDYRSLSLLRFFLVYRALVRALTASMRGDNQDVREHLNLAYRFTLRESPRLWITHGVSGSGKSTVSEAIVQRHDAIRLRSDIERKRMFGLSVTERPGPEDVLEVYGDDASEKTYRRLADLAERILASGYSVVVDATFLKRSHRKQFVDVATRSGVPFAILDCHTDLQTLRQRVIDRREKNQDASDADLTVLEHQLACHEPISDSERELVVDVPDVVQLVEML
ncbi:bifunctional aminoglycoside phosphotransferase/ATP-binding protein [Rhodopirellula baltica]|uniref:bifunctional aminoglycoside phosphotransferase/ATP-binding protein n=1 Tax=Rhodopirellula baltica TaxID=265606 RepID=UPI000685523F|nr:bifunctional aminoglycoside phosphotransferase/ATP-binding protein [Rhodopirellula baltica]